MIERCHWLDTALDALEATAPFPLCQTDEQHGSVVGGNRYLSELLWLSVGDHAVTARFVEPGLSQPPPGWRLAEGGLVAHLPFGGSPAPGSPPRCRHRAPGIVAVADGLMVNLVTARRVVVAGPRSATDAVLRSIFYDLLSPSGGGLVDVMAGPGLCPADVEPLVPAGASVGGRGLSANRLTVVMIDGDQAPQGILQSPRLPSLGATVEVAVTRDPNPARSPAGITIVADEASVAIAVAAARAPAPAPVVPGNHHDDRLHRHGPRPSRTAEPDSMPAHRPTIRLLGRIDLVGADWSLTSQQLSLLAFLACGGPADRPTIVDGLWDGKAISASRFPNLLAEVRGKIGRHHLPDAVDGRYHLAGIETDLGRLQAAQQPPPAAVEPGDRRGERETPPAVDHREVSRSEDDLEVIGALDLVRGPPLIAPSGRYWSWIEDRTDISTTIEATVVGMAHRLALRAGQRGELALAQWACRQGLKACPLDESLTVLLVGLHVDDGRIDSAYRLVDGWESRIRRLGCGEPSGGPRARLHETEPSRLGSAA